MIRVELGEEINRHGKWRWTCPRYALRGVSKTPLLDACRAIKRMGGDRRAAAGLFREARFTPEMTCTVGAGAATIVAEPDKGAGPRFAKWEPHPMAMVRLTGSTNNH